MPWDDDVDLGIFCDNMDEEQLKQFFIELLAIGYNIYVYYKDKATPYSTRMADHIAGRLTNNNDSNYTDVIDIDELFNGSNEVVLFNINISNAKYEKIMKLYTLDNSYEQKYDDGSFKIPSVDIFIYEKNS